MVFKIALGLLLCCRKELLTLDFEGILKYFRVQLPKKYRNDDQTKLLIETAIQTKVYDVGRADLPCFTSPNMKL